MTHRRSNPASLLRWSKEVLQNDLDSIASNDGVLGHRTITKVQLTRGLLRLVFCQPILLSHLTLLKLALILFVASLDGHGCMHICAWHQSFARHWHLQRHAV